MDETLGKEKNGRAFGMPSLIFQGLQNGIHVFEQDICPIFRPLVARMP
jgi:hypothetical protein